MYDHVAREALARMNLRAVAVCPRYTGISNDMRILATAVEADERHKYEQRKAELCMAYGLEPPSSPTNKPFAFANGLAIIPVTGTLINRFASSWGSVTGYNFLTRMSAIAGLDPDVQAVIFDVNSFGGEAAGCFECSRQAKQLLNGKPSMAVIDSNCYSAAYAFASGAGKIVSTPSGGAGSIGVVAMHVNMQKMLQDWGLEVTFIHAGEHKVDGNPFEPLPDDVKAEIQADVDAMRQDFAQLVADHRSMDVQTVLDTEARCFRADDALELGLIDAIATPSAAVQGFLRELSGSNSVNSAKGNPMGTETQPGTHTPETQAQAVAEAKKAERERQAGIQGCDEAKKRGALAKHLALNTELSVDEAKAILAASPEEAAATPGTDSFRQAMDTGTHPNVGADGSGEGDELTESQRILAAHSAATGIKYEQPTKAH